MWSHFEYTLLPLYLLEDLEHLSLNKPHSLLFGSLVWTQMPKVRLPHTTCVMVEEAPQNFLLLILVSYHL